MLVLCFFSVPLLCWPNYGMWYLGPNRFTMMLVCGKKNVKMVLEFDFWPRVHSCGPIPDSSIHNPFDHEVLTIANRWRWLVVKAVIFCTRRKSFSIYSKTLAVILGLVIPSSCFILKATHIYSSKLRSNKINMSSM